MMKLKKAQSLIEYALILTVVATLITIIAIKYEKTIYGTGNSANSTVSDSATQTMCNYCKDASDPEQCKINAGNITCP